MYQKEYLCLKPSLINSKVDIMKYEPETYSEYAASIDNEFLRVLLGEDEDIEQSLPVVNSSDDFEIFNYDTGIFEYPF